MKGTSPFQPGALGAAVYGSKVPRCRGQAVHQLTWEITVIVTTGIDLVKNDFAVHGVDKTVNPEHVCPEMPRAKLLELVAHLPHAVTASAGKARAESSVPGSAPVIGATRQSQG